MDIMLSKKGGLARTGMSSSRLHRGSQSKTAPAPALAPAPGWQDKHATTAVPTGEDLVATQKAAEEKAIAEAAAKHRAGRIRLPPLKTE